MILNDDTNALDTSNAALFENGRNYYYAGFNKASIQKCRMDGKEANKAEIAPDSPVTAEPSEKKSVQLDCPQSVSNTSVSTNTGDPKMNSVTLLMTGLRILLAKCVTVNVLMSVKAIIV
ncbi:uncharacterized protein LOC130417919 [Triplophysa dalaica]|uniref:uncharacterized protein LOC130417919 n=1 Tax=Triplophysa dalaica TaxID=1582913 RepID=UPI0024E03E06|nr:uncharacterized protein LOC130417919 [Triplophysa dalaica]XP_056599754.1 uncharacterized protein LOC130417919 [Triplophysa dalaica]XP_056599755.1 uncharacterized protein LOC130417919 [Triplophysa dalaica]XP_056599756.1 uncharacterized protein LOC130417919 [Triplophysa dalaica]